jgi:cyanate permease
MGAQAAVFAIGGAAGPVLAGTVFAATGSYVAVVLLTATGLAVCAGLMATPRQPRDVRSVAKCDSPPGAATKVGPSA